jgi:single-stranded DNA-binding protein
MGRLTHSIIVQSKTTDIGKEVMKFSLAVSRSRASPSGEREVDFIEFTAWNKTAQLYINTSKGRSDSCIRPSVNPHIYKHNQGIKESGGRLLVSGVNSAFSRKTNRKMNRKSKITSIFVRTRIYRFNREV